MQTKRKRKQWALLAFTMIATFVLQVITPLTANAEEQMYGVKMFDIYNKDYSWTNTGTYESTQFYSATSNKPFETALLTFGTPYNDAFEDYYDIYTHNYVVIFKDVTDLEFTWEWTTECMCTTETCACESGFRSLSEYPDRLKTLENNDGDIVCYYIVFSYDEYNREIDTRYLNLKEYTPYAKYKKEVLDSSWEIFQEIPKETLKSFIDDVCDGTIPPTYDGQFDESTATFDDSIPAPKMQVDNKLNYRFLNDDAGYMYQVKGRWRSIDNVTIENGTFSDKLFYKSTIQCDLLHWIAPTQEVSTIETSSLATIGKDYFYNFLTKYPIESRKIHFSNPSTNHENWYDVPKYKTYYDNFKDSLSSFNSVEVYVRYFKRNEDGTFSYGKWTHYYNNLTSSGSSDIGFRDGIGELETEHFQSENGLTNDEMNDLENLEDSRNDLDISGSGGSLGGVDSTIDFSKITQIVLSLFEQSKVLFSMFSTVFSFLPTWATELVAVSVVLVCFIGIWKVIR